ncbi:MAG: PorV/PorQ family protein [Candidatus Marinimicrobia bacterium]|nr:PorV/PorQ family protein [Candidatus Neomarinimicrobiota bacterium]
MMNTKILKAHLSAVIILAGSVFGQLVNSQTITKSGTTAGQFLKIGVDARGSAMGNAFTAMAGDVSSMFWNPAGLAELTTIESMFANHNWLAGITFNYLGLALPIRGVGVFGFAITNLSVPEDKVRTVIDPEGTGEYWSAQDLAVNVTFARKLTDRFSIGGNLKYIQQNIWHSKASSYAADLGALFVTPWNIRLGASLTNYGSDMQLSGRDQKLSVDPDLTNQGNVEFVNALYETDAYPLPLLFRVGLSGELLKTESFRLTFGIDALHPNDNTEAVNAGLEFAVGEMFFLRGGHANLFREDAEEGLTLGGGMHYRIWGTQTMLKIDYSYTDFGRLKNVQRISMGIVM